MKHSVNRSTNNTMSKNNLKDTLLTICKKWNVAPKMLGLSEEEIKLEAEAKLADGTSIFSTASEFAVGVDVFTKDADGNPVPAPEGEYAMEDGSVIEVGANSLITEITPAGEMDMTTEELMAIIDKLTKELSEVSAQKAELESQIANGKASLERSSTELAKVKAELASLHKAPASPSVKDKAEATKTELGRQAKQDKPFSKMTLKERIKFNIEQIKN